MTDVRLRGAQVFLIDLVTKADEQFLRLQRHGSLLMADPTASRSGSRIRGRGGPRVGRWGRVGRRTARPDPAWRRVGRLHHAGATSGPERPSRLLTRSRP